MPGRVEIDGGERNEVEESVTLLKLIFIPSRGPGSCLQSRDTVLGQLCHDQYTVTSEDTVRDPLPSRQAKIAVVEDALQHVAHNHHALVLRRLRLHRLLVARLPIPHLQPCRARTAR